MLGSSSATCRSHDKPGAELDKSAVTSKERDKERQGPGRRPPAGRNNWGFVMKHAYEPREA